MEQSKEQLAEQIYQKYFPTSNGKPFGMYEKKSVLAAIVEAMGVQQATISDLESLAVDIFKKHTKGSAGLFEDDIIAAMVELGNRCMSAPAKAVEAMPDEQEIREYILNFWGYEKTVNLSALKEDNLKDIIEIVQHFTKGQAVEAMDSLPATKENWFEENKAFCKWATDKGINPFTTSYLESLEQFRKEKAQSASSSNEDYVPSNSNTDDTSLASHSCTSCSSIEQRKLMSLEEILKIRNQLPDDWKWYKCYELAYISSRTGREFVKKHWALTSPDNKGCVHSLGLISHDNTSTRKEFVQNDLPVQFVEKSLLIIDSLLSLLNIEQNVQGSDTRNDAS
jgi:hypothetical protein